MLLMRVMSFATMELRGGNVMKNTRHQSFRNVMCIFLSMAFILTWLPLSNSRHVVVVQAKDGYFREVRKIRTDEAGIRNPAGLVYSVKDKDFRIVPKGKSGEIPGIQEMTIVDEHGETKGNKKVRVPNADPINITYFNPMDKLLVIEPSGQRIAVLSAEGQPETSIDIQAWKLKKPRGITVDPDTGTIYVIDQAGPRLVKIMVGPGGFTDLTVTETMLDSIGKADLQGIAFDPQSGNLHIFSPDGSILYELKETGTVVGTRDLTALMLRAPEAMVFAPSYDTTDAEMQMSLFIADTGLSTEDASIGGVYELSLIEPAAVAPATFTSALVNTIHANLLSPPSPDSAGVEYIPTLNRLMIADSEVNEMPIYAGANLFETTLSGELVRTGNTLKFSQEPTGIAFDPVTGNLFISDDDMRTVFEVSPGADGQFGTGDDTTTSFRTKYFGSNDPEGLAYDFITGTLFIADGVNAEVYKVKAGNNGRFDGVPPYGDDIVTQFDTSVTGFIDPEGIGYDVNTGNLYIVGQPTRYVAEMSPSGEFVQVIDIFAAGSKVAAGIGVGPSSRNPAETVIYVSDRGVDNDQYPLENDGKVYELTLPYGAVENQAPLVTITSPIPDSTHSTLSTVTFTGTALDTKDGDLTSAMVWISTLDGEIGRGNSFSTADLTEGTHLVTATVTDSEGKEGSASVTVIVTSENSPPIVSVTSPIPGSTTVSGDSVTFSGTASDIEDGDLASSIQWSSSIDGTIGAGASFTTNGLSEGSHDITATVTDSDGAVGIGSVSITVTALNAPPVVTINRPVEGEIYASGQIVTFNASALDPEDGSRSSSLRWTSSLDGAIGVGGSFSKSNLSIGNHLITATVLDTKGLAGSATVNITVIANTAPVVTITSPVEGSSTVLGQKVSFAGTALDTEDGSRTASLRWTSSLDGLIGTGSSFTKTNLTLGTHVITATATDLGGLQGSSSVTIVVVENSGPVVTIIGPADGASFASGQTIIFSGSALDEQDGDRTSSLKWTSSINGSIGKGAIFSKSSLSVGTHVITATATDTTGKTGSASITITINPVTIFSPEGDAYVASSQPNTNFGSAKTLDAISSSYTGNSYLKFSTQGITGTVVSATLRIFVTTTRADGGTIYAVSNDYKGTETAWLESVLTWSNAPIIEGSPLGAIGPVNSGNWVEVDVTEFVKGDGTYSFALTTTNTTKVSYYSKEGPRYRPELKIVTEQ
jgi:uncharacterized protein YjiK